MANPYLQAAVAAAALTLSAPAAAQQAETYGDWSVRGAAPGGVTASTATPAGSLFGVVCDRSTCDAFFNPKILCEEGREYPALLIGSRTPAFAVRLHCAKIGEYHAFTLPLDEGLAEAIAGGGDLGIAFPLDSGEFGEARFSLTGGGQALTRARERAGASAGPGA